MQFLEDSGVVTDSFRINGKHSTVFYCESKVSSGGCLPELEVAGAPTLGGADDWVITARGAPGRTACRLLLGRTPNPVAGPLGQPGPFDPSRLGVVQCVGSVVAGGFAGSGGSFGQCNGAPSFHVSQALMASLGWTHGTRVFAQFVYRDPAHPDGTGLGHTSAVEFEITR